MDLEPQRSHLAAPFQHPLQAVGLTNMNLSLWLGFLMQAAGLAVLTGALFGAVAGYVLASGARFKPWQGIALGALLPVVGVVLLAIVAIVRRNPSSGRVPGVPWHWRTRQGKIVFASLTVLCGLVVTGFFVAWFDVRLPGVPKLNIRAPGTFLGVTLGLSLLLILFAGGLSARRPSKAAAVVLAGLGTAWLFVSGAVLAVQGPAFELARSLGALRFTVGDILALTGVDTGSAVVVLPEVINPASLGLPSTPLTADDMNLAAPLKDIEFGVGAGWYLMMAFAVGVVVLALVTARVACRKLPDTSESVLPAGPALRPEIWSSGTSVADDPSSPPSGNTWTWSPRE